MNKGPLLSNKIFPIYKPTKFRKLMIPKINLKLIKYQMILTIFKNQN